MTQNYYTKTNKRNKEKEDMIVIDKFINSNGYQEYKGGIDSGSFSANVCYIDSETAKDILSKVKKNKSVLKDIFDKSDNIDWNEL